MMIDRGRLTGYRAPHRGLGLGRVWQVDAELLVGPQHQPGAVERFRAGRPPRVWHATINSGVILQSHSMEDGIFKSDHIFIGKRCTLGSGAFVHYGVTVGDDVHLATDSFLMKGQSVSSGSSWLGNPAREDR